MTISTDETRDLVRRALGHLVPVSEIDALGPDDDFRQVLELDSLDFHEFLERLSKQASLRIDGEDYPRAQSVRSRRNAPLTRCLRKAMS
jgi:acyl carrier protein